MRRILTAAALLLVVHSAPVAAQGAPAKERFWFSISGGVQPVDNSFSDAFDLTLYTEKEHVTVDYPAKNGLLIAGSGGYRVWKQLCIGFGVTRYNSTGDAKITAQVPHPFFDNTYRSIEGTESLGRSEVGAHLMFGWMLSPSPKFRVLLSAGPSFITVTQPIVTEVTFTETYPYDTAQYTGVKTNDSSRSATGFNAGADVFWMFSKSIGAGGLVQYTHARVDAPANAGRSVSFNAGGAQVGAGLRFLF